MTLRENTEEKVRGKGLKAVWDDANKRIVYYESIKRELNKRLIFECRCDARLKTKDEGSTRLAYTGWKRMCQTRLVCTDLKN